MSESYSQNTFKLTDPDGFSYLVQEDELGVELQYVEDGSRRVLSMSMSFEQARKVAMAMLDICDKADPVDGELFTAAERKARALGMAEAYAVSDDTNLSEREDRIRLALGETPIP